MEQKHRWSSLPDDIVNNIISRLNLLRDTVITISTTSFIIKQSYRQYNKPTYNIYQYWMILDNLFTLFAPPVIDTFCLNIQANHYDEPRCWLIIDTWARQLRSRNVQHMKLSCSAGDGQSDHQLMSPPSVFRMYSLVTLELDRHSNGIRWRLPNSIALPNLKKLSILKSDDVCIDEFDYKYLERLLSCCPSLEDLFLSICHSQERKERTLLITSKSLKRLIINLDGKLFRDVIMDTPILEQLDYCSNSLLSMQMLDSVSNVKALMLSTGSTTSFDNNCRHITLPELIRLELSLSPEIFQAIFEKQMIHCPNLEVIVLHLTLIMPNPEAMFMLVQRVKRIELYTCIYRFSEYVLNLVTGLLRSAKVLEKLVLHSHVPNWPSDDYYLVKSQFCQTLFECVDSTSGCQVELLGAYCMS